ncbi:MAG: MFS transporter [Dactylosporangium sp.]|nr:MFS transporter [Dactylosporangium sp.]NNJ63759.1 MFS transporter [Dactylosporangium sp.]
MSASGFLRARVGTTGTFGLAGAVSALGTVRLPALSDKLALDAASLGFALLVLGIGALAATQGARILLGRFGSRRVLMLACPVASALSAASGIVDTYPLLLAAFLAFGLMFGLLDSSMNAQAATLERVAGRHLMNGAHAGWSVGAVFGGAMGALTARIGLGYTETVIGGAAVAFPIAVLLATTYIPDAPAASGERGRGRIPPVLYLVGVVAFASFVVEGSVSNWSSLYLRDELHAKEHLAALGYPSLELAMLLGRTVGDRIRTRIGSRTMLTVSGLIGVVGLGLVVGAPSWPVAASGFFVVGLAVSTVVPLAFSIAGALEPSGAGVAQVAAMGYGGMLLGPVVLGLIANASSLRVTFAVVAGLAVATSVIGRTLPDGHVTSAGSTGNGKSTLARAGRPDR